MTLNLCVQAVVFALAAVAGITPLSAQSTPPSNGASAVTTAPVPRPAEYVIGADDVLTVVVWREKDLSGDVTVRPDGKISLPLLNDVTASGLTPDELRQQLTQAASKFVAEPTVTVVVKQINSRKVFITGQVSRPGPYPLVASTTVLQLIAMAGGVLEYADTKNIVVMRSEKGRHMTFKFNYKDVMKLKNIRQNIELKPGDTVIVP